MRTVLCPKCGADISDTFEAADPSVGIFGEGYWCEDCQLAVDREDDDPRGYDDHDD